MKNDPLLDRLAEIAARALDLHRAINGLPEAAGGDPADGDAAERTHRASIPPALALPELIARWHRAFAALGAPGGQRRRELVDLEWLETTIARTPARGDADLIAKADLLRQLVDGDPEQSRSVRDLAASLAGDIERIIGGGSC